MTTGRGSGKEEPEAGGTPMGTVGKPRCTPPHGRGAVREKKASSGGSRRTLRDAIFAGRLSRAPRDDVSDERPALARR